MAKKSIRVELSDELHRQCKIKSAYTGTPITDICREALTDWVDHKHPIILPPQPPPALPPKTQPTGKIPTA